MWSSLVEYHRPESIAKCLGLLARQHPLTVPLAGGTWLVAQRAPQIEAVVDLSALNLAYVKSSPNRMQIGAMTTLQTISDTPSIKIFANGLLRDASNKSASRTVRNVATIGGTIIAGRSTTDLFLALLVLNAQVVILAPKKIVVPLSDFYAKRTVYLPPASIITEIIVPNGLRHVGTASSQVSLTPQAQPIVNAFALVSQGGQVCSQARLALGGVTDYPIRLPIIETLISNQKIDGALYDKMAVALQSEIDDYPLSEYQREMAGIVVARALQKALERAEKE